MRRIADFLARSANSHTCPEGSFVGRSSKAAIKVIKFTDELRARETLGSKKRRRTIRSTPRAHSTLFIQSDSALAQMLYRDVRKSSIFEKLPLPIWSPNREESLKQASIFPKDVGTAVA